MGCHFLLQRIFPTQGLNPGLYHLSYKEALLMNKSVQILKDGLRPVITCTQTAWLA